MIYINHDKKAIFIHIPKTGGSYIGPTLVQYYGFTSYLPLINMRRPDHNTVCNVTKFNQTFTNNPTYDNSFFNKTLGILLYCKTSEYLNERMNMNKEKWETYTIFCFIRNPYDRTYSGWKHVNTILHKNTTFYDYISQDKFNTTNIEYAHVFMNQIKHIQQEDEKCGVKLIGRFEHLEEDFKKILNHIGITHFTHREKKVNVSNKEGSTTLSFDIKTIRRLNIICQEDLDTFHYKKIIL